MGIALTNVLLLAKTTELSSCQVLLFVWISAQKTRQTMPTAM
jgi:hypothetical protein